MIETFDDTSAHMARIVPLLDIALLGPLLVRVSGTDTCIPASQQRLVISRLALEPGVVVTADSLAASLWSDEAPASAAKAVQVLVGRLRAVCGDGVIETAGGGYRIAVARVRVDVVEFESLVQDAQEHAAANDWPNASTALDRALGMWRGAPLAEFVGMPWARATVARWTAAHRVAKLLAVRSWAAVGRTAEAIDVAERLVADDPADEPALAALAAVIRASGDADRAERVLEGGAAWLDQTHGLSLAPGTRIAAATDPTPVAHVPDAPVPLAIDEPLADRVLSLVGDGACVADVLRAGVALGDEVVLLDALEVLVARGELSREVGADGAVHLRPGDGRRQ